MWAEFTGNDRPNAFLTNRDSAHLKQFKLKDNANPYSLASVTEQIRDFHTEENNTHSHPHVYAHLVCVLICAQASSHRHCPLHSQSCAIFKTGFHLKPQK